MRSKIFKSALVVFLFITGAGITTFAQGTAPAQAAQPAVPSGIISTPEINITSPVQVSVNPVTIDVRAFKADLKQLKAANRSQVKALVSDLNNEVTADVKEITPQINLSFKDDHEGIIIIKTADNGSDDANLVKNYSKTYPVDANDNIAVENRYGKVIVNTWARNEVKVDVEIKVGADNNDDAQKALDNVTISDSKSGDNISFKTVIGEVKSSWMSIFSGGHGSRDMEINYTVYMPAKNALAIDNRYGAIQIPDMQGKISINSAYGSFKGGALPNQSDIRVKYGNADIESVGSCAIDLGYGNLDIGSANKIAANISYSGVKIGRLRESGAFNIKYGDGVNIGDMDRSVQSLAINASYANVNIGLSGDENANFAIQTHYGDFDYDGHNVTITEKSPDDAGHPHFTKSYKGYFGKGGSDKNIAINTSYGNVKFQ